MNIGRRLRICYMQVPKDKDELAARKARLRNDFRWMLIIKHRRSWILTESFLITCWRSCSRYQILPHKASFSVHYEDLRTKWYKGKQIVRYVVFGFGKPIYLFMLPQL